MQEDIRAKGMILASAPQGEYGRRLTVLTDRFGKICVFAQAAAKPKSHLLGLTLPMTCAAFRLSRGKNAWNLHGVELIDSFSGVTGDFDRSLSGMYFLELLSFFSQEGMEEAEARKLLNLSFVALKALENDRFFAKEGRTASAELIRRIFELRILVTEGEYTERPEGSVSEEVEALWHYAARAKLSELFSEQVYEGLSREGAERFGLCVRTLFKRQVPVRFKSLAVLRELE